MRNWTALRRYLDGRLRKALSAAAEAKSRQDWALAERHYQTALERDPLQAGVILQLGHAQRETGQLQAAEATYRRAIALRPAYPQAYLYLGNVLKAQGHPGAAVDAYTRALEYNPGFKPARDELIAAGARYRLPEHAYGRSAATQSLGRISATLEMSLDEMRQWLTVSAYPVEAYDAFRKAFPIQPPPRAATLRAVVLLLDATQAAPSALRRTLASVMDQRRSDWAVIVRASAELQKHSIASSAFVDPRIQFVGPDPDEAMTALGGLGHRPIILAPTGAILDREAVGWMEQALARAQGLAVTCDYDHHREHWRDGLVHLSPVLEGAADPDDADLQRPPPGCVIVDPALRGDLVRALEHETEGEQRRELVRRARDHTSVGHLPRILVSIPEADAFTPPAPTVQSDADAEGVSPVPILIVIPTRDQPDMLAGFIDSLTSMASVPDTLEIVVLDNRSASPASHRLFSRLSRSPGVDVLTVDEPFNWSRLNNLGASGRSQDIILFANDDMRMLTRGWDTRLRSALAPPEVGAIGAKLLYPNGTVQHAGTILGGHDARPMHEGVGASRDAPGPLGRWLRTRRVASVTGAFLATKREVFDRAGGFSTRLSIAYNDVDYCLKVRSIGFQVRYAADIEAVHHESVTRGLNNNPEKVAWDAGELADLYGRWGDGLFEDPTVNPQWTAAPNRPFEGFRDLSLTQIFRFLELTSRPEPWRVAPVEAAIEPD